MKYINYKIYRLVVIGFLTGLMIASMVVNLAIAAPTQVNVLKMNQVGGEHIFLSNIAEIKGGDPDLIKRLSGIVIGRSPLPGKTRTIEASLVEQSLKKNQIDLDHLILKFPSQIVVERSVTEISQEKIKALVADYISKNMIDDLDDAKIKDIRVSENLILPGGRITYTVHPGRDDDQMGKIPFTVNFDVDGKFYKRVWATATIEVVTDVVVTRKPLGRHKPITEDDIEIQKMDLAKLPSDVIKDPAMVLGQRTRRVIGSKTVLRTNLVESPPLLRRGDIVVIIAETDGLKVTALGEAKKKGRLGDRIPVANFDSKKILYARVVDANTVKVDLK